MDAMIRETENTKVAIGMLEDGTKIQVGLNEALGHSIFDASAILERKYRQAKDSYRNPEPEWSAFSRVVPRESARVALTHATLTFSCAELSRSTQHGKDSISNDNKIK